MQPDPHRTPYPAFRAWATRLIAYSVVALVATIAPVAMLGRLLPDTLPSLPVAAVQFAAGWVLAGVASHVVTTLLHDRREAARQELRLRQEESRHAA